MAKYKMIHDEFTPVSEGRHVWTVEDVTVDKIGTVSIKCRTKEGVHFENFRIGKGKQINEVALGIMGRFYKYVTGDFESDEFDPRDTIGCVFEADMVYKQGEKAVFRNLKNFKKVEGPVEAEDEDEDDADEYDPFAD